MKNYTEEINQEMRKLKQTNSIFIAEGKKDFNALIKIGFNKENIFLLNKTGTSLLQMIENLIKKIKKNQKCVILTDLDKTGRKLYHIIKEKLLENGIKTDNQLRYLLIKENISHVEGLATYLENGKNGSK